VLLCVAGVAHADFVRVDGRRFVDGAARFAFVGANLEVMHGEVNRTRAAETIAAAAHDGLRVGRVLALGEGAVDAGDYSRTHELFRAGPDGLVDGGLSQLDLVIEAAANNGMRLVVVLANHWADYGGAPMYLSWAGRDPATERDAFYDDPTIRAAYRAHLTRILSRTNARTGVRYADDPTVMAWELINESQVESVAGDLARRRWLSEMATEVHRLAPRQLVSAGIWGYGLRIEREAWRAACALPQIDYCDSHLYPEATDLVATPDALDLLIDDRAQMAHFVVGKPLVLGEVGFDTRAATVARAGLGRVGWFRRFFDRARMDAIDGAMVWIYQPWSGRERDFGVYVDRADTDDVRAVLREAATAGLDGHNPRLGVRRGTAPLYPIYKIVRQPSEVTVIDGGLGLDPTRPHLGRWERLGRYEPPQAGARPHAYGTPDGSFTWSFRLRAQRRITVRARLSSEYPGTHAPPDGGSVVVVRVDGRVAGRMNAIPDDGKGAVESLAVPWRLGSGAHQLSLSVEPGRKAHGLCVYGPEPLEVLVR